MRIRVCAPVCAHGGQRSALVVFLDCSPFYLETGLSLNSNFARLSRLADPQVLSIFLSLSSSAGIGFFSGFLVFGWQALY